MRFALMIEPQQGLTYDEQLAVASARPRPRASRRCSGPTTTRASPVSTGEPTTDAWAVLAGPRARHDARSGSGRWSRRSRSDARQPREGRDHRRRDERRTGRDRRRRRLARGRASPPRVPVPGDRRAGRDARGDARDPARPVGRARRLVVHRQALRDRGRAVPAQAGRRCRRATAAGRGSSSAARGRRARSGSPRATPTSSTSRRRAPTVATQKYAALDATLQARGREPSSITHSAMVGLLMGRDRRRGRRPASRRCSRRSARPRRGEAWFEPRRARWIHGTPDRRAQSLARVRGGRASSGSCSRTSCPATSR